MTYQVIDVRPMTKRIGAEIFGVDLTKPLGNQAFSEVHDALMEHQVIFFRDQKLDHESHKRFGRAFGELARHSGIAGLPDEPDIVAVHADERSTWVAGETWHSDLTFNEEPPMGSILYMHTVPPETGGDTMFASMYAAYDALSPTMKAFLEPLTALHDGARVFAQMKEDGIYSKAADTFPTSIQPVIRTHPVTGRKALYVNEMYTARISELSRAESDAVLSCLFDHVKNPNFHVRFRWREHSVAFWDNRCAQHMAVWDYYPEVRSGYRVTVAGDKPF